MTLIRGGAFSTSGFREEISRVQTDILDFMNFRLNDFSLNMLALGKLIISLHFHWKWSKLSPNTFTPTA